MQAALSPDGHWLAYSANPTGRMEIYVAPFPSMKSTRPVSTGGGSEPRWAHSGKELFFKSGGKLMAVDVLPGEAFTFGTPHALFPLTGYLAARNRPQYDVAPDDRRFLDDSRARRVERGSGVRRELVHRAPGEDGDRSSVVERHLRAPGTTLGRYRLLEQLGAGGMGEVWRARDANLDRDVAIKFLAHRRAQRRHARRASASGARRCVLSRLSHPGVATIFDFDTQDGIDFLVMEYVPGGSLEARIESGPLPLDDAYPRSAPPSPRRCTAPTRAASSIATSSPATSSSPRAASPRSSTSASPPSWTPIPATGAAHPGRDDPRVRCPTWRPSSCR